MLKLLTNCIELLIGNNKIINNNLNISIAHAIVFDWHVLARQ